MYLEDRNISLGGLAMWAAWVAAFGLIGLGWRVDDIYVGLFGLALSALAAARTVIRHAVRQERLILSAFELGRDSAALSTGQRAPTRLPSNTN